MQALEKDDKETIEPDVHPVDAHVGNRLRQRRLMLGLTQEKLANIIGMSFQQVQKYERGFNRVSASRLFEIAQSLQVPITYFFDDAPAAHAALPGMGETGQDAIDGTAGLNVDYASRETAELLRAYYRIDDSKKRRRVLDLIRAMNDEKGD